MSIHLMQMAAGVELDNARLKLALLCFADSGKEDKGGVAMPGLAGLMKWTGVKKAHAYNLINALIELQLLARHKPAHRGQRAEYIVFPHGCCELHGKRPAAVIAEGGDVIGLSTGSTMAPDPSAEKGSNPSRERVQSEPDKGSTGRAQSWTPPRTTSRELPTGTGPEQPLTPRETTAPNFDFSRVGQPIRGVVVRQPRGSPLGCRHCDAGYICDADGIPVSKCPHCHPAHRQETA